MLRLPMPLFVCLGTLLAQLTILPHDAECADTVETWEHGATDLDFYLGADGVKNGSSPTFFSDTMLGYGLVQRFSAYLGVSMSADSSFAGGETALYTGFFGTPVSTRHFDADLFLNIEASGSGLDRIRATPSFELNLDSSDDMSFFGVYLRGGVPIFAREDTGDSTEPTASDEELTYLLEGTLGAYVSLGTRHQVLVEIDGTVDPDGENGGIEAAFGNVALGYNLVLSESLELISHLATEVPKGATEHSLTIIVGFIATMTPWK